jgi:hypothetical protein
VVVVLAVVVVEPAAAAAVVATAGIPDTGDTSRSTDEPAFASAPLTD